MAWHTVEPYITMRRGTLRRHATLWVNCRSTRRYKRSQHRRGLVRGFHLYNVQKETELVYGVWRQRGGLGQQWMEEAQAKVFWGLRRFHFSTCILATQTIQVLNILLDCTLMQIACFCKYVVFQQKVNRQKQAMSPNLTSQTPCFLTFWRWFSKNGRCHLS